MKNSALYLLGCFLLVPILASGAAEKFSFQAEVGKLMNIIVNSLYSNKEIFLRELISNGSDALDKIRFLSLTDSAQLGTSTTLEIRIKADREARTLTIQDTGVGMTKEDLIKNLGTIAQSGTKTFLEKFSQSGDMNLIGQFGVGFYSVFLVADTVTVYSKHNDDPVQHIWQASSPDSFTVTEDPAGNTLGRGTKIVLSMKEDQDADFLDENVLKGLIQKYSEFINFPIYLHTTRVEKKEVQEEAAEGEEKKDQDLTVEESEGEEEEEKEPKYVEETIEEWVLMNDNKPIWTRNPKDVTEEEYQSFFKALSKKPAAGDPISWIHFKGEGDVNFNAIIYIPGEVLYGMEPGKQDRGWKLYVKRVFVTDNFDDLMPKYLGFLVGVADSDDLPLNVSREMLQENKLLELIKKKLVRKAIALFQQLAEDEPEKYKEFWTLYAQNVKYGIVEDSANRARLSKLLRFYSSKAGDNITSLDEYVGRFREGQDQIYYIAGESKEVVATSPLLERLVKRGYEVLYMVDPIDEYMMAQLEKYDSKYKFINVAREGLKLDDEEEEDRKKELKKEFEPLKEWLQTTLKDRVERVVVSDRLTKSPSAIVSTSWGFTANMERVLKAQALQDKRYSAYQSPKKVLEINPEHPIIKELSTRVAANAEDATARDTADLLFDTALLNSGFSLEHPATFADRIHRMIKLGLNIDASAEAPDVPEAELPQKDHAKDEL